MVKVHCVHYTFSGITNSILLYAVIRNSYKMCDIDSNIMSQQHRSCKTRFCKWALCELMFVCCASHWVVLIQHYCGRGNMWYCSFLTVWFCVCACVLLMCWWHVAVRAVMLQWNLFHQHTCSDASTKESTLCIQNHSKMYCRIITLLLHYVLYAFPNFFPFYPLLSFSPMVCVVFDIDWCWPETICQPWTWQSNYETKTTRVGQKHCTTYYPTYLTHSASTYILTVILNAHTSADQPWWFKMILETRMFYQVH